MEKSIVELLRAANREDMVSAPAKMEVKRLSAVFGQPFVMTLKPIRYTVWAKIISDEKTDYRLALIAAAWAEGEEMTGEILDKFGASDAPGLLANILQGGEVAKLAAKVEAISGFGNSVAEIKKK
jgi:hypothetical protein